MLELAAIVASRDEGSCIVFDISFGEGKPEIVLTFDRNDEARFNSAIATFCFVTGIDMLTDTEQLHNIPFMLKREGMNINLFKLGKPEKSS